MPSNEQVGTNCCHWNKYFMNCSHLTPLPPHLIVCFNACFKGWECLAQYVGWLLIWSGVIWWPEHIHHLPSFRFKTNDSQSASFLHNSLVMRWKPVHGTKLACRDAKLQEALTVAERMLSNVEQEFVDLSYHSWVFQRFKRSLLYLALQVRSMVLSN